MIPKNTVALDESDARKTLRLLDALEDNDDVQEVYRELRYPRRSHGSSRRVRGVCPL